jgi:hypothetical protein
MITSARDGVADPKRDAQVRAMLVNSVGILSFMGRFAGLIAISR